MRPLKEECFDCCLLHKCPSFYTPGSFLCTALQLSRGITKLDLLRIQKAKYTSAAWSAKATTKKIDLSRTYGPSREDVKAAMKRVRETER